MSRLEANRAIVARIAAAVEENPDWRFHQILQNMAIERPGFDQWYEESELTLNTIFDSSTYQS